MIEIQKHIQKKYAQMAMLQFFLLVSIPSYAAASSQVEKPVKLMGIMLLTACLISTTLIKKHYKVKLATVRSPNQIKK